MYVPFFYPSLLFDHIASHKVRIIILWSMHHLYRKTCRGILARGSSICTLLLCCPKVTEICQLQLPGGVACCTFTGNAELTSPVEVLCRVAELELAELNGPDPAVCDGLPEEVHRLKAGAVL